MWLKILKKEVDSKGPRAAGKEIGYSRSTVDLVIKGTYQGNLKRIEARVMSIYGQNGNVQCPVLEVITPGKCVETWRKAKLIGMMAGNPETLRLYKTCLNCAVRR